MAKEYTVSNAYPAIAKATGEQRSFEAHGNKLFVWRLFFEGLDGYYLTNRKADNAPKKGDVVYGEVGEDQFGNATFKSESRPLGQLPTKPTATTTNDNDEKLDYIITLLEQIANRIGINDIVLEGIEDKPIDLSEIPF